MFILLTPVSKEGKDCDEVAFNTDLILNIRAYGAGAKALLKFLNGDEVVVNKTRKEIVQRINKHR